MAKKSKSLEELGGLIYSTDPDFEPGQDDEAIETLAPEAQDLRVSLDKKKRKGKVVTLIEGFVGNPEDLKALAKRLKTLCGVGGSAKANEIMIQGDFKTKIIDHLKKNHYKVKAKG